MVVSHLTGAKYQRDDSDLRDIVYVMLLLLQASAVMNLGRCRTACKIINQGLVII